MAQLALLAKTSYSSDDVAHVVGLNIFRKVGKGGKAVVFLRVFMNSTYSRSVFIKLPFPCMCVHPAGSAAEIVVARVWHGGGRLSCRDQIGALEGHGLAER